MAPAYVDGGYRLTVIRVLAHCVHILEGNTLVPQEQSSLEGGRRERAASGCSFCLAATSQESGIHGRGYGDVGSGHLRQRHGVQLD